MSVLDLLRVGRKRGIRPTRQDEVQGVLLGQEPSSGQGQVRESRIFGGGVLTISAQSHKQILFAQPLRERLEEKT